MGVSSSEVLRSVVTAFQSLASPAMSAAIFIVLTLRHEIPIIISENSIFDYDFG